MKIFKWVILNEKKLNKDVDDFVDKEIKHRLRSFNFLWEIFPFLVIWILMFFQVKRFK